MTDFWAGILLGLFAASWIAVFLAEEDSGSQRTAVQIYGILSLAIIVVGLPLMIWDAICIFAGNP